MSNLFAEQVPEPDASISPPTEAPAIIVPASMPVPAVPRRAAPPRRKTPKATASEAQHTPEAPIAPQAVTPAVEGEAGTDVPVKVEKEPPMESPKFEKDVGTASTHEEKVERAPIAKEEETAVAIEKLGAEVTPPPLAEKIMDEDEERSPHDEAPPAIKPPAAEIPVESKPLKADTPESPLVTGTEQEDDERSEYSEDDGLPTEKSTMQQIEQTSSKTVQPTSEPEEEEENEEARQQRVAEKLAKMGGVNPFTFPLQSLQKTPSEDLPSPPTSPPQPTRSASRPLPERNPSLGPTTAFQLPPIPTSSLFDEPVTSDFSQDFSTPPRSDQRPTQVPESQFEGATKIASDDGKY